MRPYFLLATVLSGAAMMPGSALTASPAKPNKMLAAAIAASHRSPANVARDKYRNPAATLSFFKVKPNSKVVELWPGGGWYTEILAPYLAKQGTLTVAPPAGTRTDAMRKFLDSNTAVFGKVGVATFPMKDGGTAVGPNSVDVVLTFRNVHNWRFGGVDGTQEAFNQIYAMLKPGGVLGVVDHRLPETMDSAKEEKSGYMKRSSIVAFAEKAGLKLDGESEINANPKDTHDWPDGVWTLPPVYRLKDVDRDKYAAIGESDRMTLRFVKPRK
jgi:predicted methyltransferase